MADDGWQLEKIRKRYIGMVALRNDAGAPDQEECDIRDLLAMIDHGPVNPVPGLRDASYFLKEVASGYFMEHKDEAAEAVRDLSDQLMALAKSKSGPWACWLASQHPDSGPIPTTDLPDPLEADA